MEPGAGELILRLALAAVLGGAIGYEREWRGQAAGFRTHILVSLGSALFTAVGAYAVGDTDPTRIAAQVVTGIGFLGAGAIVTQGVTVRGLTTAASLWVTAAVGIAAGLGYWTGAVVSAVITLIALIVLKELGERLFAGSPGRQQLLLTAGPELRVKDVVNALENVGAHLVALNAVPDEGDDDRWLVTFRVARRDQSANVLSALADLRGVRGVQGT